MLRQLHPWVLPVCAELRCKTVLWHSKSFNTQIIDTLRQQCLSTLPTSNGT